MYPEKTTLQRDDITDSNFLEEIEGDLEQELTDNLREK